MRLHSKTCIYDGVDDCERTIEMQALLCKKERLLATDLACRV